MSNIADIIFLTGIPRSMIYKENQKGACIEDKILVLLKEGWVLKGEVRLFGNGIEVLQTLVKFKEEACSD